MFLGYDDDASYADDIDALQLEDGCKVLKHTGRKEEIYRIIIGSSNITSAALTKIRSHRVSAGLPAGSGAR